MNAKEEIAQHLKYFPRNDTYLIRRFGNEDYFRTEGEEDVFRRWGKANIFVNYLGNKIIRFEMHPIPCTLDITGLQTCSQLGYISLPRLVSECWDDDFKQDAVVVRKNQDARYPNAANNLIIANYGGSYRFRDPLDYEMID